MNIYSDWHRLPSCLWKASLLIRVVYSAKYIFTVVVMFRYIDALFRNCDGPQLRGRENLARVSYILGTPNMASVDECSLAPIVHVF